MRDKRERDKRIVLVCNASKFFANTSIRKHGKTIQ
jgi:hypothetical protein